jgi:YHS domain-containing protein
MAVDPDRAVGRLTYYSRAYFFCSLTCAAAFGQNPDRFVS